MAYDRIFIRFLACRNTRLHEYTITKSSRLEQSAFFPEPMAEQSEVDGALANLGK